MKVGELIKQLESYANAYGDDIPVYMFRIGIGLLSVKEIRFNYNDDPYLLIDD